MHESIARETGGLFWDITAMGKVQDFSSLLGTVASTIAGEVKKKPTDGSVSHGTDMGAALQLVACELRMPPMPDRGLPSVLVLVSDGQPADDLQA